MTCPLNPISEGQSVASHVRVERDLLPVKAVKCDLAGKLIDFYRSCKGEGITRPCGYYLGNYLCSYVIADFDPRFKSGKDTARARVRVLSV